MSFPNLLEIFSNLDLLAVSITTAATLVLGFTVYFSNTKSVTNRTFLLFTIITAIWSIANYFHYKVTSIPLAFILIKFVIFLGVWHSFIFFLLFYVFPKENASFSKVYKFLLIPLVLFTSLITLTPLVFKGVAEVANGRIAKIENGPAIALFGILITSLIISGIFLLIKRVITSSGTLKKQFQVILSGVVLTFILILTFNFVLPAFFDNPRFIPLSSLFIFPFIAFTSYAILKHKLFNIKVAATGLLVFALSIVAFGEVIFSRELFLIIYRSSVFILILSFGILLIKGVLREVEQREKIEVLAKDLEEANKQQENLLHFITHQIKGFLTKSKYIFAELLEGTFGSINSDVKNMAQEGLKVNTDGVQTVQTILNAANIKTGKMKYDIKLLDLKEVVRTVFEKYKRSAEEKSLGYSLEIGPGTYGTEGDIAQLTEALSNLIDNAIRYTPKGEIKVKLDRIHTTDKTSLQTPVFKDVIVFSVKDTGIGIAKEDIVKLFGEGERGKDALKVNVDSTGFGLYIVKNIIEAHNGKVWAESEGPGKGSEFIVELPTK